MFTPRPPRHRSPCGFTLVELLVVITIIAVLAALSSVAYSTIQRNARRTEGVTNMRQLGAAMASYAADNSAQLPGPLYPGQVPYFTPDKVGRITGVLARYLDIDPASGEQEVKIMIPPAFKVDPVGRDIDLKEARVMVLNKKVLDASGTTLISPFGYETGEVEAIAEPMRTLQIPEPSRNWALSDADRQHPHVIGASWAESTTPTPYHGNRRAVMFFDWHVELADFDADLFDVPAPAPVP